MFITQIWSRLPPEKVPRSLRIVDGETHAGEATAAAAASIARRAVAASASNGPEAAQSAFSNRAAMPAWKRSSGISVQTKGTLPPSATAVNAAPTVPPSASVAYENVRACEACFTLHQTEASLVRAERRLAAAVAGTQAGSGGGDGCCADLELDARSAARRRTAGVESQPAGSEGRGSWAGGPHGHLQRRGSFGGGEGRRGLGGSRSASSLGGPGKRQEGVPYGKVSCKFSMSSTLRFF